MNLYSHQSTNSPQTTILKSASLLLALLFILSPLDSVFAQEIEAAPVTVSGGSEAAAPSGVVSPSVTSEQTTDPTASELVVEPVSSEIVSPEAEPIKEKGPKKDKESEEDASPTEPELEAEAMSARTAESTEPEEQVLGRYVAPSVSATNGALNYNHSIVVPAGRNDLTPNHNLVYDSNNKTYDTVFGVGWSIDIPYIQRINKKGSELIYSDSHFISSLDGELEDQGGGTYVPRTENGSFLQYEYVNDVWTVTDKQGTKYTFGATAQARQDDAASSTRIYSWMLETVTDTNGNTISYDYFKDQGQIYPESIKYNQDEYFEVRFIRSSSTKERALTYRPAFGVFTYYEITDIQIFVDGELSSEYDLSYQDGLITDIESTGYFNASSFSLPPTNFEYSIDENVWNRDSLAELPYYTSGSNQYPIALRDDTTLVDANGDGLSDFISPQRTGTFDPNSTSSGVWINQGDNTWERDVDALLPSYMDGSTEYPNTLNQYSTYIDVNGDGHVDFVRTQHTGTHDPTNGYYGVWINQGDNTWERDASASLPSYVDGPTEYPVTISERRGFGDVNGDGLIDMISTHASIYDPTLQSTGVWINQGDNTWERDADALLPSWTEGSSEYPIALGSGTVLADSNGDGLIDFIKPQITGTYDPNLQSSGVWINQGDNTWERDADALLPSYMDGSTERPQTLNQYSTFVDINGDGHVDFSRTQHTGTYDPSSNYYGVWINQGDNTWTQDTNALPASYTSGSNEYAIALSEHKNYGDVNGDGLIDMISTHTSIYDPNLQSTGVWINQGDNHANVIGVTNTTGGETIINYAIAPVQDSSNSAPMQQIVVESLVSDDQGGNIATTTYSYSGADYYYGGAHDRKFAGFEKVTRTNPDGSVITTKYHQANGETGNEPTDSYSLIGKVYEERIEDSNENLFERTRFNYEEDSLGGNANSVLVKSALTQRYDGTSGHTDTALRYTYDQYGNVLEEDRLGVVQGSSDGTFIDTGSDDRSVEYEYYEDTAAYIVGLPSRQELKNDGVTEAESVYLYDNDGNLLEEGRWIAGTDYATTSYTYNSYGLVDSETDPVGNTTTYTYDTENRYPITVTNALLQDTDYTYDYSSGKVLTKTDPNGGVVEYIYDGLDRLVEEKYTQENGGTETVRTIAYNTTASPQYVTETIYRNVGDTQDVRTYLDGFGRTIQTKSETDAAWATIERTYDEMGRIESMSLPYETNSISDSSATTDSDLLTTHTYDPLGRVLTATNARGTTDTDYDGFSTTVTDPLNNDKIYTTDAYGNLVQVEEENDGSTYTTQYEYSAFDLLTKITDAENNVRNISYDGLGRRTQLEDLHTAADSTFGVWDFVYDDQNLVSMTDPEGNTTTYTHDDLNRTLTEDSDSVAGTEITYVYDSCTNGVGQVCSVTTPGVTTAYTYWKQGLVATSTVTIDATAYTTNTEYNRQKQPVLVAYPNGDVVTTSYNTQGLPEEVQTNGVTRATASYGVHGKPEQLVQANGLTTQNTYDATDLYSLSERITGYATSSISTTTEVIASTSTEIVTSTSTIPGTTTTQFSDEFESGMGNWTNSGNRNWYQGGDNINRPGTSGNNVAIAANCDYFCYMTLSNPIDLSTATSAELSLWRYLSSTLDSGEYGKLELYDGTTWTQVSNWTDDNQWHQETFDLSNYLVSDFNLRLTGRMNSSNERVEIDDVVITMTTPDEVIVSTSTVTTTSTSTATTTQTNITFTDQIQNLTYEYDAAGNIISIVDASDTDTAKTQNFVYDDLYRLTSVTTTDTASGTSPYTQTFAYSPIGNITNFDGTTLTYSDNGYNNPFAVTSVGSTSLSYDNNGNLTDDSTWTHGWDYRNRLVSSGDGVSSLSYTYNHHNERAKLVDGADVTVYPFDSYQIENGTPKLYLSLGDMTVATVEGATTTYIHTDHLGGTTLTTNSGGEITKTLDYMPYGETRIDTGTNEETQQFTGLRKDSTTGLNYSSARYYNPTRGAFISQDPVSLALGDNGRLLNQHDVAQETLLRDPQLLNAHGYARNNPLKYNDPNGELPVLALVPVALKIGGAALTAYSAYEAVQQTESNVTEYGVVGGLAVTGSGFALDAALGKLKVVDKAVDGIGGAYKNVRGKIKGNEAHHMPADSVSPVSKGEGPAISMSRDDHIQTASWGRGADKDLYRSNQSYLIGTGRYMDAFEMDVNDVQSKFGNKYDDAIKQAREQAKKVDKETKE